MDSTRVSEALDSSSILDEATFTFNDAPLTMEALIQFLKRTQVEHNSIVHSAHIKLYWQIGDFLVNSPSLTNTQLAALQQYGGVVFKDNGCSILQRFADSIPNIVLLEMLAPYLSWEKLALVLKSDVDNNAVLAYLLRAIENPTTNDAFKKILAQKTLVPSAAVAHILAATNKRQLHAISMFLNGKQALYHQHLNGNIDEAFENTLFSLSPIQVTTADTNVAAIVTIINNAFYDLKNWMPTFLNMMYWHLGRILSDVPNEAMAGLFNMAQQQHCNQLISVPIMQQSKLLYNTIPNQLEVTNFCAGKTWDEVMDAIAL